MYAQKSIGILICGVLTLSVITGCGNSTANQNTSENGTEAEITTEAPYKYDEVVFYQTPSCKITFKGIEFDSDQYDQYIDISFLAENIGKNTIAHEGSVTINGYVCSLYDLFGGEFGLEPGTKVVCHKKVSKTVLDEAGIDKVETIELTSKSIQIGEWYDYNYEELTGSGLTLDPPFELNWEKTE